MFYKGWYDPATLQKAIDAANQLGSSHHDIKRDKASLERNSRPTDGSPMVESSDEDIPGPLLPGANDPRWQPLKSSQAGPTISDLQDLELRKGMSTFNVQVALYCMRNR